MVRLAPGEPRPSTTTRRVDLPAEQRTRRAAGSPAAVLRAVLDHGPVARSTIARSTGLSAASVSTVTADLIERGLVREAPEAAGPPGFGRPHVPVDLETDATAVVGVHVAVSHVTVALLDPRGNVIDQRELPHCSPTPQDVVRRVADEVADLCEQHRNRHVASMGVALGGWVDAERGVVLDHPVLGWRDVELADPLAEATGLETQVEGHARALLRAEQLFGDHAERARRSAVHLFVGNVVDVAFSVGGRVHEGPRSAAGRVGWLEPSLSARGLLDRARSFGVDARHEDDLRVRAQHGDERLLRLFVDRAHEVGRAVATLLDLFDPEVLVVSEPGFSWLPQSRAALLAEVPDGAGVVVPSSFGSSLLALAGGGAVLDRWFATPL